MIALLVRGLFLAVALGSLLIPAPAAGASATQRDASEEVLTNEAIVAMVQAGLGENLIVQKIRTTPVNFDLSTEGLIRLKKAGVSDTIISAMLAASGGQPTRSSVAPPRTGTAIQPGSAVAIPEGPNEPGIYYVKQDGGLVFVEGKSPGLESGGGERILSALTFGIRKYKSYGVLRGTRAPTRITDPRPTFLIRLQPGQSVRDLVLIRLDQHRTERKYQVLASRAIVGSADYHLEERAVVPVQYERLAPDFYRVIVDRELDQGEYAFIDTSVAITEAFAGRAYDFSIVYTQ